MPDDESAVPEAADDQPAAPAPEPDDPTMEVADAEATSDPAATEVGTAVVPDPTPDPLDNPAPAEADDEEEEEEEADEEPSLAEKQANYEPPPALSQAEYVQGLMVQGHDQGEADRRKTIARNRERRAQQHAALHRTNRPDNA